MLNSQQNMQQAPFTTKVYRQQICNKTKQVRNETATNPDETPPYTLLYNSGNVWRIQFFVISLQRERSDPNKVCDLSCEICCLFVTKQRKSLLSFSTFRLIKHWYLIIYVNILQILRSLAITLQKKNPEIPKTIRNQRLLASIRRKNITGNDCRDKKAGWE